MLSEGYRILCDNLYKNWTNEQKFYFTQDFVGNVANYSCEVGYLSVSLIRLEEFILQLQNLVPDVQKEQLSYLNKEKILYHYVLKLYAELA